MEYAGLRRLWADFSFQDHLNSRHGLEDKNRRVLARAYQSLAPSINSPIPEGDFPEVPQNVLDVESFSRGWYEAFGPKGKPWL